MHKEPEILITCALRPEASAIAGRMTGARRVSIGNHPGHRGVFAGHDMLLVRAGPGSNAARMGTASALDFAKPKILINFGTAGAIDSALAPGDCLISRAAFPYDPAAVASNCPNSSPGAPETQRQNGVSLSSHLCNQLAGASEEARFAVFGSADYSVSDPATRDRLRRQYGFDAVDWETFAVLRLAEERGVPAFAFRVITDRAGPAAGEEFLSLHRQLLAQAAERLERILEGLDLTACKTDCRGETGRRASY